MSSILERKTHVERMREIKAMVEKGEKFSAFDLAVAYYVSINAIYRDVRVLKGEGLIPLSFAFTRRARKAD